MPGTQQLHFFSTSIYFILDHLSDLKIEKRFAGGDVRSTLGASDLRLGRRSHGPLGSLSPVPKK